jgi:diguanylate cyclase (GGDEF)-like protein
VPDLVRQWAESRDFPLLELPEADAVHSIILRGFPCFLFLDADRLGGAGVELVRRLKSDAFTAIVPVVMLSGRHDPGEVESWFAAGSDEVVTTLFSPAEQRARIDAIQTRTERDVSVHPSTRLPGTTEIEREIRRRLDTGGEFAVCYADLDHFKEFNDRYSYYDGDRVIYLLSRVLHDVVKGMLGPKGFVGHIGGDDFIFIIPLGDVSAVCTEIIAVFDTLVPMQYNEQDRRAGYFFGKDRRGQLHRVPLMTLSIGIVTNRNRRFAHPAQVSELATEMKSYAKTLPGSVFVVDRRQQAEPDETSDRRPGGAR